MAMSSATLISTSGLAFQPFGSIALAARVRRGSRSVTSVRAMHPMKIARDLPRRVMIRGMSTEPPTRPMPAGAKINAILFAGRKSNFVTIGVASSPITSSSTPANESWTTARKSLLLRRTNTQPWYISVHMLPTTSRFCVVLRPWAPCVPWGLRIPCCSCLKSPRGINAISPAQAA